MLRHLLATAVMIGLSGPVLAQESRLERLDTGDDSRGWEAVGRLNFGNEGFCTGSLISPRLVLTAAHCLFRKDGSAVDPATIEFLAGWRNGRALAYRGARRTMAHPDYVYTPEGAIDRVINDLALIELDRPIRVPSIVPFGTDDRPSKGDEVGVVSYAQNREEAPSLQQVCHVLARQPGILMLSCSVDFGSSGAPVFSTRDGIPRIVSVVSAKAEVDGKVVALGSPLGEPLTRLQSAMDAGTVMGAGSPPNLPQVHSLSATSGGAKFVRPEP